MNFARVRILILGALGLVFTVACSQHPRLVSVEGRVKYRKKPLTEVAVQFISEIQTGKQWPGARAATDAEGFFQLKTPPYGPGAIPGKYKVVIFSVSESKNVPGKYATPNSTPLEINVPEEGLSGLELELTK